MKIKDKYLSFYYETSGGETPEPKIDPKKTALLLVDLQNEFVSRDYGEALEFKASGEWERWIPFHDRLDDIVIPNNKKLLDFFRKNDMTVTYGRIACLREDGEDRSPVQKSEGWNGMLIPVDSYGAQMVDELAPMKNEIVVNKTTDSVTTGTNYLTLLQFMGIETVVVTGIVTDQCVASTVRGLADAGYKVICVEDACAAGSQELHDAELKIMNVIYCDVLTTDETIALIEKNLEKANKKREKMGLPPQKAPTLAEKARMAAEESQRQVAQMKKGTSQEDRKKKIQESTDYYKNTTKAKPGSIAAKARMVQQYNEKNKK